MELESSTQERCCHYNNYPCMDLEVRQSRRRYLPNHDHVQPLASCFYNSQESCGSFVGCLSESFSADCHRTKCDSRNDLCPASTHSIAIDSPPSVFLVQSGVASCSSLLLPFLGFGFCLTSYLSISHLSLSESGLTLGYGPRHAAPSAVAAQQHAAAPGDSIRRQHLTPPPPPSSTPSCMPGSTLLEWTDRRHALRLRRLAPRDSSPLPLTWLVVYCNSVCTTKTLLDCAAPCSAAWIAQAFSFNLSL